jgi:hypothetical protein
MAALNKCLMLVSCVQWLIVKEMSRAFSYCHKSTWHILPNSGASIFMSKIFRAKIIEEVLKLEKYTSLPFSLSLFHFKISYSFKNLIPILTLLVSMCPLILWYVIFIGNDNVDSFFVSQKSSTVSDKQCQISISLW